MSWLRRLLLALLLALLVGLGIGTWLRLRFERAPRYLGAATIPGSQTASLGSWNQRDTP